MFPEKPLNQREMSVSVISLDSQERKINQIYVVFCRITFSSVESFSPEVGTRTFFHAFALISEVKQLGGQRQVAKLPIHGLTSR